MRIFLSYALAAALAAFAWGAQSTAKKKAPAKKATHKSTSASHKTGKKAPVKHSTTWRNRQLAPSPERYKEIQDALVTKGYLKAEDTGAGWNQTSVDALKRFQTDQKIDNSGKINSLSLIALGLGPKHDANPTKAAEPGSESK